MRKLFNEFFYIPQHGKVREKVMMTRLVSTIAIVIMCLAAMSITAYAYFSYNITSGLNTIKSANFETKVSIQISDSNNEPVTTEQLNAKTQVATLHGGNEYSVTIEKAGTAQTGFCVISATGCNVEKYHTQQIGKDVKSNTEGKNIITFKLMVTDTTVVSFYSHWGTSSYYADYENKGENDALYIIDGETVTMQINGVTNPIGNTEEEKTEEESTPSEIKPTEVVHTVESGETLSKIAEIYNTTSKRIAVYNEIADPNSIQVGQKIKIPPDEWALPETSTSQPTTHPETTAPPETSTPAVTTPPETSEPTGTMEPSSTESTTPTTTPEPTESTATTETQPVEETTGAPTTEANS